MKLFLRYLLLIVVTLRGLQKHQTIEVRKDKTIVQCRGKNNPYPTVSKLNIIQKWTKGSRTINFTLYY